MNISVVIEPYGTDVQLVDSPYCAKTIFPQHEARKCFYGMALEASLLLFEIAGWNFTLFRVEHFYPGNQEDVWRMVGKLLHERVVDFSAAFWTERLDQREKFYFVRPSIWLRPNEFVVIEKAREIGGITLRESLRFNNVFTLFDRWIWFGLVVSLCVGALLVAGCEKNPWVVATKIFEIYRIAVNQAESKLRQSKIEQRLMFLCSLVAMIAAAYFSGCIYMKTTVEPGWVQPFHNLVSMKEAGYRLV